MRETILFLTTARRLKWLKGAIETFRDHFVVVVVDDATPEKIGMRKFCQANKIGFITKKRARGLTDSWNIAYNFFRVRKHRFQNCILSNDDVRFPPNFSKGLIAGIQKYHLVGPLANWYGAGDGVRFQNSQRYLKVKATSANVNEIQKMLEEKFRGKPFLACNYVNGFCFAFSQSIHRFAYSKTQLVNPEYINMGGEWDLVRKIRARGGKIAVCRTSFVFHWKMGTYREIGRTGASKRDWLWNRK